MDASYEEMQEFIRLMGGAANLDGSEFATILATYGPEFAAIACGGGC